MTDDADTEQPAAPHLRSFSLNSREFYEAVTEPRPSWCWGPGLPRDAPSWLPRAIPEWRGCRIARHTVRFELCPSQAFARQSGSAVCQGGTLRRALVPMPASRVPSFATGTFPCSPVAAPLAQRGASTSASSLGRLGQNAARKRARPAFSPTALAVAPQGEPASDACAPSAAVLPLVPVALPGLERRRTCRRAVRPASCRRRDKQGR